MGLLSCALKHYYFSVIPTDNELLTLCEGRHVGGGREVKSSAFSRLGQQPHPHLAPSPSFYITKDIIQARQDAFSPLYHFPEP